MNFDTHDPYEDDRNPYDDEPTWRELTAKLGEVCVQRVRDTFAWLDRCIATEDDAGVISWVIAMQDLQDGRPIRVVLGELMIAAEDAGAPGRDRHAERSAAR